MQKKSHPKKLWALLSTSVLGVGALVLTASGENFDLNFERTIKSTLKPQQIQKNLETTLRWPAWFHSTASAKALDDPYYFKTGSQIELSIDPKKGKHKKFSLLVEVLDYQPMERLKMRVLKDSSQRLTRLFEDLIWTIEIKETPTGSLLKGTVTAQTQHWKSRLFGRLSEKILLNQIFYPDLIELAQLKQPFSADPRVLDSLGRNSSFGSFR